MQKGMTRKEACFYLGVSENATSDEIKRAFRYKVKLYHPDVNPDLNTYDYYIKINEAYDLLINNPNPYPYNFNMTNNARPAKVFYSTAQTKASYNKQKEKEKEVEKLHKWDVEKRENKIHNNSVKDEKKIKSRQETEEEALEKIRAILLAENIKRQIEIDKQNKEAMQKKKLYEAFMQHELNKDS
jgi:DnaJ-class molecular chaperone